MGASDTQKIILAMMFLLACMAMYFAVRDFFRGKTVVCAWEKCKHNRDGVCRKAEIKLDLYRPDEEHEGLVCDYYKPEPDKPEPGVHIDIRG